MAARDERRAVLILAVLAAAGGIVRVAGGPQGPPGGPVVAPELAGEDPARQAALSRRAEALAKPLLPGERVDVDRAAADELDRLPRVGPELARRILEDRERNGPFGSLEALGRVSGVGPRMLAALAGATAFSGVPRSSGAGADGRETAIGQAAVPAASPAGRRADAAAGGAACRQSGPLDLNLASARELDCLPGIGPVLAGRIVADRAAHGHYRSPEDLERVPGVGARLVARLRPFVAVR